MTTFGDPGFLAHKSMTQFMSLLAYSLADATVIPFNLTNYAVQLDAYYDDLQATINETATTLDTDPLRSAIDDFAQSALELEQQAGDALGADDAAQIDVVNHKYRDFQRGFVSQGGLPGREFFKHLIFAPGADTGEFWLCLNDDSSANIVWQVTRQSLSLESLRPWKRATFPLRLILLRGLLLRLPLLRTSSGCRRACRRNSINISSTSQQQRAYKCFHAVGRNR